MTPFDPARFRVFPDGAAISREDLTPCPCGRVEFVRLLGRDGRRRTVCPDCVRRRSDEEVVERVRMNG